MTTQQTNLTILIKNEILESARKVRYYDYLARHLTRINNALQFSGVIASMTAFFTLLGNLETPTLILLGIACFTLTLSTLRNYATRAQRCSEISQKLARIHLDWQEFLNKALIEFDNNMLDESKRLLNRQAAILEHIPLDLTLSRWLADRAQRIPHDDKPPSLQSDPSASHPVTGQAHSL